MTKAVNQDQICKMNVEELEQAIRHHNRLYWDLNQPEITDYDYDRLVEELKQRAPDSQVLQDLGPSEALRIGAAVVHQAPMLSLDKCYTAEDLKDWAEKFEGEVLVMPKMDGIAASLRYDAEGRLFLAATRGSGTEGDEITANARTIAAIPQRITGGPVEIRGEIYMRLSVFASFAEEFSNPRNLAAGAIKHKDPARCQAYSLSFVAYDVLGAQISLEREKMAFLKAQSFSAVEHLTVDRSNLRQAYEHFAALRDSLDYEIDGVVFKTDRIDEQVRLGATAHHPRYAIAYKFQGDSATTILEDVSWSVARTGVITPVAHIRPVTLSGAEVSRASLHNAGFLEKLGLLGRAKGAQVVVTRRGGVIPKVEFVTEHAPVDPASPEQLLYLPQRCPSCGGPVKLEKDFIYCQKPESCKDAMVSAIAHYASVIDIQGFGDKLLASAFAAGLLQSPVDLYKLTIARLTSLERVGQKLAANLIKQVDAHRRIPLAVFLQALGIDDLGKKVATLLEERFQTLERVRQVKASELSQIYSVGEIIAEHVVHGLKQKEKLIDELLEQVTIEEASSSPSQGQGGALLAGQSFLFTGKLLSFDRKLAQKRVLDNGGETPSSVTAQLTYLVVGDGAEARESNKLVKARGLIDQGAAIKIISESQFLQLIEEK